MAVLLAQILSLSLFSIFIFQLGRFAEVRRETPASSPVALTSDRDGNVVQLPVRTRGIHDLPRAS